MYDVAVVGGGPAGATLARRLAEAGRAVVLLEAHPFPRDKPCGGGLTMRALAVLPAEVRAGLRALAPGAVAVWGRARLEVAARGAGVGLVLRREFDAHLLALARQAGAEVQTGARVTGGRQLPDGVELQAGARVWRARFVACADGATGPSAGALGQALGLGATPPRIGALEVEIPDPNRSWGSALRGDFDVVPGGYGWVFPKAGLLSVGVASWRRGIGGRALRQALLAYLDRLGLHRQAALQAHGHPIPVGGRLPVSALVAPRALRLGDAAGFADPLFGEGISHALESAEWAAEALIRGDLRHYTRWVEGRLYPSFRAAAWLARLFYPVPGLWCWAVSLAPGAGNACFALAVGGSRRGFAF